MPELSDRANRILNLLVQSARIAISFLDDSRPSLKKDHTLVTRADRAVEEFLSSELEDPEHDVRVIGEETFERKPKDYLDRALTSGHTWIIDPIDGTVLFAHRIPLWGISIGYAENGRLVDGGILIPGTGEVLLSDRGVSWYAQGTPFHPDEWDFPAALRPLDPPQTSIDDGAILNFPQFYRRRVSVNAPCTILTFCSSVYSAMLLATGRNSALLVRAKLWDHAGYLVALKNLGFRAPYLDRPECDLLSLDISPDLYIFDYADQNAFRQTGYAVIAASPADTEKVAGSFHLDV